MSVAPNAGIVDFGTFQIPTDTLDGVQGQVPAPLAGQANYVLTALGWAPQSGGGGSSGTVTSVNVSGGTTGLTFSGGPVTISGTITAGGTLAIANGGTGASTAGAAITGLGATTLGGNLFTLTNVSAIAFPRINADNTVSALDAAAFRTAIGAGTSSTTGTVTSITSGTGLTGGPITTSGTLALADTTVTAGSYTNADITVDAQGRITAASNGSGSGSSGTVTSVSGTGTVSGLTLTGTVTTSGSLTLGGTLVVTPSAFASQSANTILAAPSGADGVPTFRAIVAADVPILNQNTTGTAANVTGVVDIANGGTGASTAGAAITGLGATTLGGNLFTLTNVSAIAFPRINADNTVSTLDAAAFRTAIGAGTSSTTGTVTSVDGAGTVNGITLTGTVTSSGSLTLGGALSGVSLTTQVTGTLPITNGGTGQTTATAAFNALAPSQTGNSGKYLTTDGTNTSWATVASGGGATGFEQTFMLMGA